MKKIKIVNKIICIYKIINHVETNYTFGMWTTSEYKEIASTGRESKTKTTKSVDFFGDYTDIIAIAKQYINIGYSIKDIGEIEEVSVINSITKFKNKKPTPLNDAFYNIFPVSSLI